MDPVQWMGAARMRVHLIKTSQSSNLFFSWGPLIITVSFLLLCILTARYIKSFISWPFKVNADQCEMTPHTFLYAKNNPVWSVFFSNHFLAQSNRSQQIVQISFMWKQCWAMVWINAPVWCLWCLNERHVKRSTDSVNLSFAHGRNSGDADRIRSICRWYVSEWVLFQPWSQQMILLQCSM